MELTKVRGFYPELANFTPVNLSKSWNIEDTMEN